MTWLLPYDEANALAFEWLERDGWFVAMQCVFEDSEDELYLRVWAISAPLVMMGKFQYDGKKPLTEGWLQD